MEAVPEIPTTLQKVSDDYYIRSFKVGKDEFIKVDGKPITISGYEEFEFFVHHPTTVFGMVNTKIWRVSEAKTGTLVGSNQGNTIKAAIEDTKRILDAMKDPKANLERAISYPISRGEVSPRYGGQPVVAKEPKPPIVKPEPKPPAMSVVEYDRQYSLKELREKCMAMDFKYTLVELKKMCVEAGLSPRGHKKELAAKLIEKGVK